MKEIYYREKCENTEKRDSQMEEIEQENTTIKAELKDVASQLLQKNTDLVNCKFELQRHRLEIDVRLFETKLSYQCSFSVFFLIETQPRYLQFKHIM